MFTGMMAGEEGAAVESPARESVGGEPGDKSRDVEGEPGEREEGPYTREGTEIPVSGEASSSEVKVLLKVAYLVMRRHLERSGASSSLISFFVRVVRFSK